MASTIPDLIAAARRPPEAVLEHIGPGSRVVVGAANGEPAVLLDAIEAAGDRFSDVELHQMLAPRPRPSIGGGVPGARKATHRGKIVTTAAHGDEALFAFIGDNPGVEFHPVDYTNDPWVVAREPLLRAVNATLEVDFLGQCASESLGSQYLSSSGGQPDFARAAVMSERGEAFIVLHSTTHDDTVSRIVPQLHPGAAVTTFKNIVDNVVTEYGVAELRGATIAQRTRRLIAIAHPHFRDELTAQARVLGYM